MTETSLRENLDSYINIITAMRKLNAELAGLEYNIGSSDLLEHGFSTLSEIMLRLHSVIESRFVTKAGREISLAEPFNEVEVENIMSNRRNLDNSIWLSSPYGPSSRGDK